MDHKPVPKLGTAMSSDATPRRTSSRRRSESVQLSPAMENTDPVAPMAEPEPAQPTAVPAAEAGALAPSSTPVYSMRNRPIDPSQIDISYTVSIAGTRPVMRSPKSTGANFRSSPSIHNRPIAPNQTEDSNALMGYLD